MSLYNVSFFCVYEAVAKNFFSFLIAACVAATAAGTTMGWTSAASHKLKDVNQEFHLDEEEFSWAGAFLAIGAFLLVVPLGSLANTLGRKKLLIFLAPWMTIGWAVLAWADSVSSVIVIPPRTTLFMTYYLCYILQ